MLLLVEMLAGTCLGEMRCFFGYLFGFRLYVNIFFYIFNREGNIDIFLHIIIPLCMPDVHLSKSSS